MQSLCKVLEHADCYLFACEPLGRLKIAGRPRRSAQFSCACQGQFNVPVVADFNPPHDSMCAAGGPCLMTTWLAGYYPAWSARMIGAASATGPRRSSYGPIVRRHTCLLPGSVLGTVAAPTPCRQQALAARGLRRLCTS